MNTFSTPWGNYLLTDLVEALPPEVINWWPQTIAWQLIFIVILIYIARAILTKIRIYRLNAYRRTALAWLNNLPQYCQEQPQIVYRSLPAVLKKTALIACGREQVSHLSGTQWEQWLDAQCQQSAFSSSCATLLHQLAYAQSVTIEAAKMQTLIAQAKLWVEHHRSQYD